VAINPSLCVINCKRHANDGSKNGRLELIEKTQDKEKGKRDSTEAALTKMPAGWHLST
jgi:hypothetical protein